MKKIIFIILLVFLSGCSQKENVLGADLNAVSAKYNASEIKDKYQLDGVALERKEIKNAELDKYKGEPKDEVEVILGDKQIDGMLGADAEFEPNIELKRWNEVSFKIKPKGIDKVGSKDKNLSFEKDKIKFSTPKMNFEMYNIEDGYKYIWFLNEKPKSNIVEFDIETAGLDFFYQPPLTQEYKNGYSEEFKKEITVTETQVKDLDGNVLAEKPENVVGSYAVYHSTKGGMNDINGKDYKVGKAFHLFRPRLCDTNNNCIWGDLFIDISRGIYQITIDLDFLNTAKYPIKCE
jgi:hypothetical protein